MARRALQEELELLGLDDESEWDEQDSCQGDSEGEEGPSPGGAAGPASPLDEGDAPDDLTCAICLGQIPPLDMAFVKGCEHQYCVHCILQWSLLKEWCPQCKAPFSHLFTHRHLDGTPSDYPLEEGVTLLKRARWFVEEHEVRERARDAADAAGGGVSVDA